MTAFRLLQRCPHIKKYTTRAARARQDGRPPPGRASMGQRGASGVTPRVAGIALSIRVT